MNCPWSLTVGTVGVRTPRRRVCWWRWCAVDEVRKRRKVNFARKRSQVWNLAGGEQPRSFCRALWFYVSRGVNDLTICMNLTPLGCFSLWLRYVYSSVVIILFISHFYICDTVHNMRRMIFPTLRRAPSTRLHCLRFTRSFITLPGTEPQSLTATRILPYKSSSLYKFIADIDSYSTYLPYCLESKITKWSAVDREGNKWPAEATLKVGWGGFEEKFTSRIFCAPGSVVEALSGEIESRLPRTELQHHAETLDSPPISNSMFTYITTQWTVKPFLYKPPTVTPQTDKTERAPIDQTEVHLTIDFQFANPLYAAVSKTVAPKVAGIMIEAFEVRARQLLDKSGASPLREIQ